MMLGVFHAILLWQRTPFRHETLVEYARRKWAGK